MQSRASKLTNLENAIKNIIPASNVNDLRKVAMLNSIKREAVLQGVISEIEYNRYVYFVLRTYTELGARPQELGMYLSELYDKPYIKNDRTLEKHIRDIVKKKLAATAPPSNPDPPPEYATEVSPLIKIVRKKKCRMCSWLL